MFPAWKQTPAAKQLDEMGEKFEEIEEQQFGGDGYEDAVEQIGDIEGLLGLADISQFTAPPRRRWQAHKHASPLHPEGDKR